jgi:hypothetical protein
MTVREHIASLSALTMATLCGIPACSALLDIQAFPAGPVNDASSDDANGADGGTAADGPASLDAPPVEASPASDDTSADVADASVTDVVPEGSLSDSSADANKAASGACNDGDTRRPNR